MKKVTINGNETKETKITFDFAKIDITNNNDNLIIYGEKNEINVHSNYSIIHIYGNNNSLTIYNNFLELHIYGDHLNVSVFANDENLHIYGDYNSVFVKKGSAISFGYYCQVSGKEKTDVEYYGKYNRNDKHKNINFNNLESS